MAVAADRRKLLYKLAKAYYEDQLTQEEIGKRFGLSRIKVSRLLQQARQEKVVQIHVISPTDTNTELEHRIEQRYGISEAVVVTPPTYESAVVTQSLGPAAADCLLRSLQGHEILGLTWGTGVLSVVDALPVYNWPDMKVVQLLGGLGRPEAETHGTDLTRRAAQAFGTRPWLLPAPGIVSSKLVRDALLADPQIAGTLALGMQADLAIVGIGRPTARSVVMQSGILTEVEFAAVQKCGAVGDIGLRFFDTNGHKCEHEINDRIIGLNLDQIRQIPRVIGVAGGLDKFEVIRAALRGQLIDVLVTDDRTATRLV